MKIVQKVIIVDVKMCIFISGETEIVCREGKKKKQLLIGLDESREILKS